jgi:hypothetical protein
VQIHPREQKLAAGGIAIVGLVHVP